jgi:hypothetical protein
MTSVVTGLDVLIDEMRLPPLLESSLAPTGGKVHSPYSSGWRIIGGA